MSTAEVASFGERKNHGILAMGKWWKPWENHGKTIGKPWIYLGKPIGNADFIQQKCYFNGAYSDLQLIYDSYNSPCFWGVKPIGVKTSLPIIKWDFTDPYQWGGFH